ncbi:MAG TPA: VTT domain-containing protein [Rectinemataceae bacterium]|nr:VTT domain-containing protein [Rectinemataceae bacterium]
MKKDKALPREIWAFPLFLAAIILTGFLFRTEIAGIFRDREEIRAWIRDKGVLGPFIFIGLQIVQVVVFVIPGELTQTMGGFVFGFWRGSALSVIGIAIGSLINYGVGRLFGRPFVLAVLGSGRLGRAENALANRKAEAGFFLLFLVPGIPKDVLCYFAGMVKAPPSVFLAASMIARLPGIVGSALIGTATYSGRFVLALSLLAAASLALIAGIVWRKPLEAWLTARSGERKNH